MDFAAALVLAATLADLSWLAGHWSGTVKGVQMEEVWLAPRGNVMPGVHRDVKPDGGTFFEFARIEATKEGIVFFAQPLGRPPTPFELVELKNRRAVFESPEHDFPQRIIYWREGARLCARIEGPINGKEASEQWCWARVGK
jgi:hypothetical protein